MFQLNYNSFTTYIIAGALATGNINKYIEIYKENNGRSKTRWNGAETAKNAKKTPKIYTRRQKRISDVFFLPFLTPK